jgi:hypothetical protein
MNLYLLAYRRGPNWIEGEPVHKQPLRDHLDYLHYCSNQQSERPLRALQFERNAL